MPWPFTAAEILTANNLNDATKPGNAVCQVKRTTAQSITDNTATIMQFDVGEDVDPLAWRSDSVNPTRITPTIAGWYEAIYGVTWQVAADYNFVRVQLYKNGAAAAADGYADFRHAAAITISVSSTGTFPLIEMNGTTDYLELNVQQDNTASAARNLTGRFCVRLVYPT